MQSRIRFIDVNPCHRSSRKRQPTSELSRNAGQARMLAPTSESIHQIRIHRQSRRIALDAPGSKPMLRPAFTT